MGHKDIGMATKHIAGYHLLTFFSSLTISVLSILTDHTDGHIPITLQNQKLSSHLLSPKDAADLVVDYSSIKDGYYIPQCHSFMHNATLVKGKGSVFSVQEEGESVGDVIPALKATGLTVQNQGNSSIEVYCTYVEYTHHTYPKPGGCNMEFNFENDPNIHTWYDGFQLWVQFQYSSTYGVDCDNSKEWTRLTYSIYAYQFDHDLSDDAGKSSLAFNETLSHQLIVPQIKSHATKLLEHTRKEMIKPAMVITAYPDHAVWITVVVTDTISGYEAAYVPKLTYGCSFNNSQPCKNRWYMYVMAAFLAISSLFLLLAAHRYFVVELVTHGFLSGLLCSVIVLLILRVSSLAVIFGSLPIAVGCGVLWFVLWWGAGVLLINMILPAANTGYLLASILFYSPLVNVSAIFQNSWETWIFYAVAMLLVYVFTLLFSKKMNILCCTFLGSYGVTAVVSLSIHSTLHHIIIEPIRRATVERYYSAVFSAPFSGRDGALLAMWIVLWIVGAAVQFYTESGKPEFPVSPRKRRKDRQVFAQIEEQDRLLSAQSEQSDLRSTHRTSYGATDPSTQSNPP